MFSSIIESQCSYKKGEKNKNHTCEALKDFEVAKMKVEVVGHGNSQSKELSERFRIEKINGELYISEVESLDKVSFSRLLTNKIIW